MSAMNSKNPPGAKMRVNIWHRNYHPELGRWLSMWAQRVCPHSAQKIDGMKTRKSMALIFLWLLGVAGLRGQTNESTIASPIPTITNGMARADVEKLVPPLLGQRDETANPGSNFTDYIVKDGRIIRVDYDFTGSSWPGLHPAAENRVRSVRYIRSENQGKTKAHQGL